MKFVQSVFNFFSSIKLAVIIIVSMAVLLGVGTFYEASHGTVLAQKLVYHSWYSNLIMALLVLNLACAVIDRYPWKKHHTGFVITHAGIIIMIFGAFLTQQRGIEGILYVGLNEGADTFSVDDTELRIYQSFDSKPFVMLSKIPVDFDRHPPEKKNMVLNLVDDDVLKIIKYYNKAERKVSVMEGTQTEASPALKFKLENPQVHVEEWVGLGAPLPPYYDLGPALVTFLKGEMSQPPQRKNQIVIYQSSKSGKLYYAVYSAKKDKPTSQGPVTLGQDIDTGWMGLKFSVTEYYPHAEVSLDYIPTESDSVNATSVIKVKIGDRTSWFELDSPHEIQGDKTRYFISFVRRRYNLGFNIKLKKFKMSLYGGSTTPSGYESTVEINSKDTKLISMNEPIKENGFTIYQSSYEQNERGEPIASIFSVNYDPGRIFKYLGAICIVIGIATMFYWKPQWTRRKVKA